MIHPPHPTGVGVIQHRDREVEIDVFHHDRVKIDDDSVVDLESATIRYVGEKDIAFISQSLTWRHGGFDLRHRREPLYTVLMFNGTWHKLVFFLENSDFTINGVPWVFV